MICYTTAMFKTWPVMTLGSATRDIMVADDQGFVIDQPGNVEVPRLLAYEYGTKVQIKKPKFVFGGGGMNAAVNLAGLGFKVAPLLSVGHDEIGREIIGTLHNQNITTDFVQKSSVNPTSFSFIITTTTDHEHVAFYYAGANRDLRLDPKLTAIAKAPLIYIAPLASDQWSKILQIIQTTARGKIVFNPGSRQLSAGLKTLRPFLSKVDLLSINHDEAITLALSSGKKLSDRQLSDAKFLAKFLQSYGPRLVVVTLGKNGSVLFDGQKFYNHRPKIDQKKVKNTTGVGDCFTSTLAASYFLKKYSLEKSLRLASKNATAVSRQPGAQAGLLSARQLFN